MIDRNIIVNQLQGAVDTTCTFRNWCQSMMSDAQPLALEGEKRRHEVVSQKLFCLENDLIKAAYDGFEVQLVPNKTVMTVSQSQKELDSFTRSFAGFVELYDKLHSIANSLVVANAKPLTCDMYSFIEKLWCKCIVDLKRRIRQVKVLADGKATHHILVFQQSWCDEGNVHDYWESKE